MKIQKKNSGWGREGEGSGLGGQGGCDRRIEKFLGKFTKKKFQGGGGSVEELKFMCKLKKKIFFFWGGGRVWGVRMGVNEELKCFCEN